MWEGVNHKIGPQAYIWDNLLTEGGKQIRILVVNSGQTMVTWISQNISTCYFLTKGGNKF